MYAVPYDQVLDKYHGHGRHKVEVELWNIHHMPARPYNPFAKHTLLPRYLVGTVGVRQYSSNSRKAAISSIQHITYDLGNPLHPFLVVDECRACHCQTRNGTVDNCPYNETSYADHATCTTLCWPSRPYDVLSKDDWRPMKNKCMTANSHNSCMQCFDDGSHSRFYVPGEAQHLVLISTGKQIVSQTQNAVNSSRSLESNQAELDLIPLGTNFQFAALTKIVPEIDRMWGNFGIGYNSSFLQQMQYTSFLLHLRVSKHGLPLSNRQSGGSFILFNPDKINRKVGSIGVKYIIDDHARRVHKVHGIGIDPLADHNSMNIATKVNMTLFHIDSGNNGISVNDTSLYEYLRFNTHGEWRLPSPSLANDLFGPNVRECETESGTASKVLFVPFNPATAPSLIISLSSRAVATIPGSVWVISEDGATLFSTYHKNVLGLPFLSCSQKDFLFDDDELMLYMIDNQE